MGGGNRRVISGTSALTGAHTRELGANYHVTINDDTDDEPQTGPIGAQASPGISAAPTSPIAKTFTPRGSATVPTHLWTPAVKNEIWPDKPHASKLEIITIESSHGETSMVRKAIRKFRLKPDAANQDPLGSTIKTTVEKAAARIAKIRPWKDADGEKLRKKQKRRVMLALKRKKKRCSQIKQEQENRRRCEVSPY